MHEMGDQRPTQNLRHLRNLAGPSVPSNSRRTVWTNRLPLNIQDIIDTQSQGALDALARMSDKIGEVTPPPCVARVSSSGADVCTLTAVFVSWLGEERHFSTSPSGPLSPSQKRRHARRSSRPAGRSPTPDNWWYHRRFQERANRRTAPCTWKHRNTEGSR